MYQTLISVLQMFYDYCNHVHHVHVMTMYFVVMAHRHWLISSGSARYGRRWPLCLFHILGGVVCIASPFVPSETSDYSNLVVNASTVSV